MVAAQLPRAPVQHHFGRAARAAESAAAVAAKKRGRKAAPVEIHQRHATLLEIVLQQFQRRRGKAVVERQAAHIQHIHLRQRGGGARARAQFEQGISAALRFVPALEAGRGAAQHNRASGLLRAPHSQIAGLVAQFVFLLERAVVLFIHHNQPHIGQRRKHGQPRADNQFCLAKHGAQIILRARTGGGLAVQHGGGHIGKTRLHTLEQLRREVDFGQQKQHLPALGQHLGHSIEIHFGFAAAGDAIEQKRLKAPECGLNVRRCGLLLLIQNVFRRPQHRQGSGICVYPRLRLPLPDELGRLRVDFFERGHLQAAAAHRLPQRILFAVALWRCVQTACFG